MTLFRNARIWDGISDDIDAGLDAMEVQDGTITRLGSSEDLKGQQAIDLGGAHVIPGLMDAHIHLCLNPEIRDPLAHDKAPRDELLADMRERARAMLAAGITTARDLGGGQWLELQIRDEVARGELAGTRLLCSGQPVTSPGGHCHFWGGEADSTAAALAVIARQVEHGVDLIKIMATGGNITPGSKPVDSQFAPDDLTAIVEHARSLGYRVAAHCHGTDGIGEAARAGVTTIEHCSWVGADGWGKSFDPAIVDTIVDNEVWVSPTINAGWHRFMKNEAFTNLVRGNYARMRERGVRLIASTDAGIPNVYHHDLPRAIPAFAHFAELSPVAALRTATSECAAALGIDDRLGRLAPGYVADFLVFDDNPLVNLETLTTPAAVYQGGRLIAS